MIQLHVFLVKKKKKGAEIINYNYNFCLNTISRETLPVDVISVCKRSPYRNWFNRVPIFKIFLLF